MKYILPLLAVFLLWAAIQTIQIRQLSADVKRVGEEVNAVQIQREALLNSYNAKWSDIDETL